MQRTKLLTRHLTGGDADSSLADTHTGALPHGPLHGIRVVELTTAVQGPGAGQYLCDMGAEVIRVEGVVGDGPRHFRGIGNKLPRGQMSPQFAAFNLGKRSISLDLKHELSRQVLVKLLDTADVFLANYTQRALDNLGLSFKEVHTRNPKLVYATASGYGPKGPLAKTKGLDGAAQALSGLVSLTGYPEEPMMVGDIVADTGGAIQLALAVVTALVARERFGVGQYVTTSLYGAQLWSIRYALTHVAMTGSDIQRQGPHYAAMAGGAGVYVTKDGQGFMLLFPLTVDDPDAVWRAICDFGGHPEYGVDERFKTQARRLGSSSTISEEQTNEIRGCLRQMFKTKTMDEWASFMQRHPGVVWAPVRSPAEVINEEQALANDYVVEIDIPEVGRRRVVGNVITLSHTPGKVHGPPPLLGADARDVMRSVGISDEDIETVLAHSKSKAIERLGEKRGKDLTRHMK